MDRRFRTSIAPRRFPSGLRESRLPRQDLHFENTENQQVKFRLIVLMNCRRLDENKRQLKQIIVIQTGRISFLISTINGLIAHKF